MQEEINLKVLVGRIAELAGNAVPMELMLVVRVLAARAQERARLATGSLRLRR